MNANFQICLLFIEESIPFSMRACFKLPNATQNRTETYNRFHKTTFLLVFRCFLCTPFFTGAIFVIHYFRIPCNQVKQGSCKETCYQII